MLILSNNKPDFKSLFKDYIDHYESYHNNFYSGYNLSNYDSFYDDDYDSFYDDYDSFYDGFNSRSALNIMHKYQSSFSSGKNKNKKRGTRGSKHKGKCISLYSNNSRYSDNKNNMFDSRGDDKIIYFYDDIDNPDSSTIFYNVFDFDKFCDEEGIEVDDVEIDNLLYRSVSHCCINPKERLSGKLTLMTETSYGNLRWECAESNDELINTKTK